ncbi:homocysteine-responsive endoplasmic reticulum-resident ubiquitin-like domain member 2 protein [Convolutriloba macropyga]|uniref:homocysteine-responsive endoplasmic reticulum-resident ubiquitin-like domain member 2 protein n=1 Tax=Convolutriloba macropyga TaxID=536237 RepID=UPI003F51B145
MSEDKTNSVSTKEVSEQSENLFSSESSKSAAGSSNTSPTSGGTHIQILLKTLTHGDRKITCSSEICVKDLKCQISREFPSQPKVDDQKLIHAGILLKDDVKLSTAFKMQIQFAASKETCSEFIVHLVCTAKGSPIFKRHEANMSSTSNNASEPQFSGTNLTPGATNVASNSQSSSGSGNRSANAPLNFDNTALQSDYVVNYINSNITKEQYAEMVADMHEQHKTYYESVKDEVIKNFKKQKFEPSSYSDLNSTINLLLGKKPLNTSSWASGGSAVVAEPSADSGRADDVNADGDNERNVRQDNDEARAILEQRQRENAAVINAAGGFGGGAGAVQNEENGEENDWLSWFYRESRLVILLIILYSYSSLNRVLTVGVITALMYFFQRRWLPLFGRELMRRNDDNNNINNDNENNQQNAPQNNENEDHNENDGDPYDEFDGENAVRNRRNPESSEASNTTGAETPVRVQNNQPEAPTRLARVYSAMETLVVAVTTFFVSLFPIELRQQNV